MPKEKQGKPRKRIGFLIKLVNDRLKAGADADLMGHDLTFTQSRVLRIIKNNGGEATQKQIEDLLEVAHPTVVGIIARLKDKGFIECRVSPQDKRNRVISTTAKADETMDSMCRFIDSNESKMLKGISKEREEELERTLLQILGNLDDMKEERKNEQ